MIGEMRHHLFIRGELGDDVGRLHNNCCVRDFCGKWIP